MTIQLKGGHTAEDPRLGRVVQFDERSRAYPIRALLDDHGAVAPRSYSWPLGPVLDQGNTSACVGFSWTGELISSPVQEPHLGNDTAQVLYHLAQQRDEWPGEQYDGSSVIGGAKAVVHQGYMHEYRWGFGVEDLALAVGHHGPCVIGINWYEDMFKPDSTGRIAPGGSKAGGHAILVFGYSDRHRMFRLRNSWGGDWGVGGNCSLSYEDMDRLLHEDGEVCAPVRRIKREQPEVTE